MLNVEIIIRAIIPLAQNDNSSNQPNHHISPENIIRSSVTISYFCVEEKTL